VAVFFDDISEYRDQFQQYVTHFNSEKFERVPFRPQLERNTTFVIFPIMVLIRLPV